MTALDAAEEELRRVLVRTNDGNWMLPITPRTIAERMLKAAAEEDEEVTP